MYDNWNVSYTNVDNNVSFFLQRTSPCNDIKSWSCSSSKKHLRGDFHNYVDEDHLYSALFLGPKKICPWEETFNISCDAKASNYVGVKKKLNHTAAQDYCLKSLTKFSVRGKLAIFQNDSGLANIRDFIKTIENNQENNMNIYWTGVKCESNTGHCKFSDGTDASFANKITGDDGICVAVPTHGHPKRSNCLKPNYFICKITNFSSQGIIT